MFDMALPQGLDDLKARLKATWNDGNYDYFARLMESSAVELLDRVGVLPGSSLLDVACGTGQLAIVAARRGVQVTGVDIAPNSIAAARRRAAAEHLDARFDEGDAEALPYPDASFDTVASIYGAMFAPRPDLVARELLRVCRPGGRIVMGNWTREGFVGRMFGVLGRHIPPPDMPAPVLWGDERTVQERLGAGLSDLQLTRVRYRFNYPFGPQGVVDFFRANFGPVKRAFEALGEQGREALRRDLHEHWASHNLANGDGDRQTLVDAEYLQVVGRKA